MPVYKGMSDTLRDRLFIWINLILNKMAQKLLQETAEFINEALVITLQFLHMEDLIKFS